MCNFYNLRVYVHVCIPITIALSLFAVIRTLSVTINNNRNLILYRLTPQQTLQTSTSVSISNPALQRTSSDNLLAHRPNCDDDHAGNSNLGVIFLNLNGIFPCMPPETWIPCGVVALEEDAFSGGFKQSIEEIISYLQLFTELLYLWDCCAGLFSTDHFMLALLHWERHHLPVTASRKHDTLHRLLINSLCSMQWH